MRQIADYGPAPIDAPEIYPGTWPSGAVMVTDAQVLPVQPTPPTDGRSPILAIGSNACPAQISRKGIDGSVLLTPVVLRNHLIVYAGHTTRYGAIPATVVRWPGARCEVFLTWLTPEQHRYLDTSEGGNYDRVMLPTEHGMMAGYRARSGRTTTDDGQSIRLASVHATGPNLPQAMTQTEIWSLRAAAAGSPTG